MSRIDEALKRADRTARIYEPPPLGGERGSSLESVLDDYPLEPGASLPEPVRDPVSVRTSTTVRDEVRPNTSVRWNENAAEGRLVVAADASPAWVEQYRRLAATLYQTQTETGLKTVMVSSALPREGKTLTVANLALTLSESYAQRVLVIDADLRNPSIHDVFGLSNETGLSEYLRTPDAQAPIVNVSPTLSVVPGGRANTNPIAGLVSDRMKQLMEFAATGFDWVLLDTPPVGLLPDANLLARLTDAVVFVVAASSSPYPVVQRALSAIGPERVIGIVLNRAAESMLPSSTHYSKYAAGAGEPSNTGQHHG